MDAAGSHLRHFEGYWVSYSGSSGLDHITVAFLGPDGSFWIKSEDRASAYSDGSYYGSDAGNVARGRWSTRGDKFRGVIILAYNNGTTEQIPYEVCKQFNEYYFDGQWFGWATEETARDFLN